MTAFFRHRIIIYLFSAVLCLGFGLKTIASLACKWSHVSMDMEDKSPSGEDKNAKDDKSGRPDKKMFYCDVPNLHQQSYNTYMNAEAHNRVYLLAIIAEPLITIPIEPPEFSLI